MKWKNTDWKLEAQMSICIGKPSEQSITATSFWLETQSLTNSMISDSRVQSNCFKTGQLWSPKSTATDEGWAEEAKRVTTAPNATQTPSEGNSRPARRDRTEWVSKCVCVCVYDRLWWTHRHTLTDAAAVIEPQSQPSLQLPGQLSRPCLQQPAVQWGPVACLPLSRLLSVTHSLQSPAASGKPAHSAWLSPRHTHLPNFSFKKIKGEKEKKRKKGEEKSFRSHWLRDTHTHRHACTDTHTLTTDTHTHARSLSGNAIHASRFEPVVEGTACTVMRQANVNCVRAIRAAGTAGGRRGVRRRRQQRLGWGGVG